MNPIGFIVTVGFYLPAFIFALRAHTTIDWINSVSGFALGSLLLYIMKNRNDPTVKRWLDRF
jgi:membrane associated rhomboid family serine protease